VKKLTLIVVVALLALSSSAQNKREQRNEKKEQKREKIEELIRQSEEGVLVYEKQNIFGIQLRTNGYGAFYEMGRMKTNRKTNIYRIDFQEIKHAKEEKLLSGNFIFGNPYIFGKINYFYPVTLGFGQQVILGQKGNKNGVAVSVIYNGGLSIGLLRPYYVSVDDQVAGRNRDIKYSPEDSALFLSTSAITAGGGFGKGWSELKVKPGIFAKAAMRFDYGRFNESVNGIEVGASIDAYASKIPIMFGQKDDRLFYQVYLAILFGKRK
jgi:hypothetical protein